MDARAPDDGIDNDTRGKAWLEAYVAAQAALKVYRNRETCWGPHSQKARAARETYLAAQATCDKLQTA